MTTNTEKLCGYNSTDESNDTQINMEEESNQNESLNEPFFLNAVIVDAFGGCRRVF